MTRASLPRKARLVPLPMPAGLSRAPRRPRLRLSGLTAEAERLVRQRAGYVCEACCSPKACTCVRVVRFNTFGVPEEVWTGPANGALLCEMCAVLARGHDALMWARGFLAYDADPRLMPMTIACGGSMVMVWRSVGGRYLSDPMPARRASRPTAEMVETKAALQPGRPRPRRGEPAVRPAGPNPCQPSGG